MVDKYWIPPNYKEYYKNTYFNEYDKELLIINNKYNIEWGEKPFNYFSIDNLIDLINLLKHKYTIIYVRPSNNLEKKLEYSWDHNTDLEFDDEKILKNMFGNQIILFNDLFRLEKFNGMNYNLAKLYLFSSCDNYINVQGGGSHFTFFFAKKLLILHIRGDETINDVYNGWYKKTGESNNMNIKVIYHRRRLINSTKLLFLNTSNNI